MNWAGFQGCNGERHTTIPTRKPRHSCALQNGLQHRQASENRGMMNLNWGQKLNNTKNQQEEEKRKAVTQRAAAPLALAPLAEGNASSRALFTFPFAFIQNRFAVSAFRVVRC